MISPNHRGVCTFGEKGLGALEVISIIGSSFQALSDWVSAILPFFLIKDLVMPRRTKIALICILGLGVMASIAALVRMGYYHHWSDDKGLMCEYSDSSCCFTPQPARPAAHH